MGLFQKTTLIVLLGIVCISNADYLPKRYKVNLDDPPETR